MSNPKAATPEATALEAAADFIKMAPALWTIFLMTQYSLTPKEAQQAAEKFLRDLEGLLGKEGEQ